LREDKIDEQALTWGQTDAAGVFRLDSPVARGASYTVAVVAEGYLPLVQSGVLSVSSDAPPEFDPWERIALQRQ
jgi:hypothetical protein